MANAAIYSSPHRRSPMLVAIFLALASLGCGSPDNPPPKWCEATGSLQLSCEPGEHCLAVAVIDYQRLEPRGYRAFGVTGTAVTRQQAESIAATYLVDELAADPPDVSDCEQDGDFIHCAMVYQNQDRYLVIIHRLTGQVVFAGLELWADADKRGYDFPLPSDFSDAASLGCVDPIAEPVSKKTVTTGIPDTTAIPSTADDALALTRLLNLAERFAEQRPYHAFVISHAPALGGFDPESADWYVWLTLAPQ